jgi:hypothetical protein
LSVRDEHGLVKPGIKKIFILAGVLNYKALNAFAMFNTSTL